MLNLPVPDIKAKIVEQTKLSVADVDSKIADKMKQLSGLISEEGACHIIANELGVKLLPDPADRKVSDLLPGMRDVQQDLKVIQVYDLRSFPSKFGEGEGHVCSFLGGDESGIIRVTCWGEKAKEASELTPGDIVRVNNGYVKENNDRSELHLNNNSNLVKNPKGVTVETSGDNQEYNKKKINELTRGDYRVSLLGTIVQVSDPRFFDKKDGSKGMVVNLLLDDGTGNVRCSAWDDSAAKLLGSTKEDLLKKEGGGFEEEKTSALGVIVSLDGRAKLNTVYNNIEVTIDTLDLEPKPEENTQESSAEKKKEPEPKDKKQEGKPETDDEEPILLDDVEEVSFDDIEEA